jgi:hypothetical protein
MLAPHYPSRTLTAIALAFGVALAGCGKSLPTEGQGRGAAVTTVAGTGQVGASGLATKNTTRLGGADPIADAAAVALATNPGLTPTTRPQAVVLVDAHDWPAALAAAALASSPLRAPLLYSEGDSLPAISAQALAALKPTGAALLGGAQVIEVGTTAAPAGYRTRVLGANQASGGSAGGGSTGGESTGSGSTGGGSTGGRSTSGGATNGEATGASSAESAAAPASLAAQVARLVQIIHGGPPHRVIVIGADGPRALAMPAAGLAAESGAPILPVGAAGVPPATRAALARLRHPTIYVVGPPTAVSHAVLSQLGDLGSVHRIDGGSGAGGATPAENAIAVARFEEGSFGWGIEQPGHGLVFANASRPLDAPAAAPLSASGDYGPLLLLEYPDQVPGALTEFLSDIQPGYSDAPEYQPVRGVYNHGWLIGDGRAITATVQAELDAMLEISPRTSASSSASGATSPPTSTPSTSTTPTTPTSSPSTSTPTTATPTSTPSP